jgi:hypothetical protein
MRFEAAVRQQVADAELSIRRRRPSQQHDADYERGCRPKIEYGGDRRLRSGDQSALSWRSRLVIVRS